MRSSEHQPKKRALGDPTGPMGDFRKRAQEILAELQKELLPEHASEVVAINAATGEYILAPNSEEAGRAFRKRWPGTLAYVVRVDGGPVLKYHGFSPV
jgi:hypothetical protein